MRNEIKVGFFVLAGIVLFGFSLFMLGDFSIEKRYPIYVIFDDVGGLANKSNVKLNGVEVGKIRNIWFEDEGVIVEVLINEKVKIYKNSKFYIASTSIIGSKFLQIEQGKPSSGVLKPGEKVYAVTRKPIEEMILDVAENVNMLIKEISKNGELAENLNETVKNLRGITSSLNQFFSSNSPKFDNISSNLEATTLRIKDLTAKLDNIITRLEKGEGTIGTLLTDEDTKNNVKQSILNIKDATKSLKDFVGKTSKIRTYWRWDFKYEPKARESYNDVGLKIFVNENKYYYAGISNFLNIKNKPRGISYEIPNTVDAYLGWKYPAGEFYIGIIRATGGFGIKYIPFYDDDFFGRFSLNFEANEFSRNRRIKGRGFNDARYDVGVDYKFNENFAANLRITDILEVKRLNISTKVLFEDKDIAYLLGFVGGGSASALVK